MKWWSERELNPRHKDFQSFALPTELSDPQMRVLNTEVSVGSFRIDNILKF